MNLRFLNAVCFFCVTLSGCVGNDSSFEESEEMADEESTEISQLPKNHDQKPEPVTKDDHDDKSFGGPCPVDTYLILEKDGVKYMIEIQVFCDPIQNIINLGCPEPY